eukprot:TRINITY_DN111610_c0_g1_i1.p1 TRINITY_DN111610_c0_g1~~TRINITY_DN111610_c0_g1_i1.p1  ORF type:complete len:753 (-),score=261.59 TRINITY_DN111610_c0_g1_i1:71-2329(-)
MTAAAATQGATRVFSIEQAEAELAAAAAREQELELDLEKLYNKAAHLCQSEARHLAVAAERHKQVPAAVKQLQETLQQTSGVADELSGRVRKLDVVCGRVSDALKLVDDMLELRECSDQVMKSISSEDFEQAAKYVARFRAAQENLPPGTDDASVRVLKEAEVQLSGIVRKRFEAAMASADGAAVSRFAKLFHPLGLASEGVQKYLEFIRKSLAEKCASEFRSLGSAFGKKPAADADNPPYAQALLGVFIGIADIVQEHQEAVEQEFGPENFIVVIRGLLEEADVQGLKVIDKFFKDNAKVFDNQAACDMREVGLVLAEVALLTQRTQQFNVYIHNMAHQVVEMITDKEAFVASLPEGHSAEDGLITTTRLLHRVQELVSQYVCVEQVFLVKSVEKAVRDTDCLDPFDVDAKTTTLVDDAFFILQEAMLRSITTCDVNAVCAVVNNVGAIISNEVKDALSDNLGESRRLYGPWISQPKNLAVPQDDDHPLMGMFTDAEGKLRAPLTSKNSWPHSMNNLQQSISNLDMLKVSCEREFDEYFPADGVDADKRAMFEQCVKMLDESKGELENLHQAKCKDHLQMLKVHLSPMLLPLDTIDYEIGEAQYADFQVNDPFAKAFNSQAELIYQHLKAVLNATSCEEIMQQMAEQTCRRIEKAGLSKRFSLFGALQFETDVRALCSFFTSVSEQALRHKFARLFEMSSILSLESVSELRELYGETRSWRLTPEEMRKLITSRVDLPATEADLEGLFSGF